MSLILDIAGALLILLGVIYYAPIYDKQLDERFKKLKEHGVVPL